jgi:predicted transcriptional regulator
MLDILLQILIIANEPVKKTHILYSAGLNYYQLSKYLNFMLKIGLIEEFKDPFVAYKITGKGRDCLKLFASDEIGLQVSNSRSSSLRLRKTIGESYKKSQIDQNS